MRTWILILAMTFGLGLAVGCGKEESSDASRAIQDAAKKTEDAAKEGADKVEDAAKDAADAVKDAAN